MRPISVLAIGLMSLACEAPYWTEGRVPDHRPEPVVLAVVSPDSIPKVFLDMTRSLAAPNALLPNDRATLEAATIGLMQDARPISLSLFDAYAETGIHGDPIWNGIGSQIPMFVADDPSDRIGSGVVSVRVDVPGHDPVTGTTRIPAPVPVQVDYVNMMDSYLGMEFITQNINNEDVVVDTVLFYRGRLTLRISDPSEVVNLYGITLLNRAADRSVASGNFALNLPVDPVFRFFSLDRNNSRSEEFPYSGFMVFSDATFNGKEKVLHVDVEVRVLAGTPPEQVAGSFPQRILIMALSKDYHDYIRSSVAQVNSIEIPFSEPVPVVSNLSNGFGVLGAYRTLHMWERE